MIILTQLYSRFQTLQKHTFVLLLLSPHYQKGFSQKINAWYIQTQGINKYLYLIQKILIFISVIPQLKDNTSKKYLKERNFFLLHNITQILPCDPIEHSCFYLSLCCEHLPCAPSGATVHSSLSVLCPRRLITWTSGTLWLLVDFSRETHGRKYRGWIRLKSKQIFPELPLCQML